MARRAVALPRPSSRRSGGGTIRFCAGPSRSRSRMKATAKVINVRREVVLDGGGKVTLSGEGRRRILYMDTCDQTQGSRRRTARTRPPAADRPEPGLRGRQLHGRDCDGGGGGAIFVRGGRLKIVNSAFVGNRCDHSGPDIGGGAIRALQQFHGLPVDVVGSTFGGGRRVQQRRCAEQHRRVVGGARTAVRRTTRRSARRQPGPRRHARAAAAAARSTATATCSPSGSPARSPRQQGRTRAAGRCSSSATTAPARCRSRTASCSTIRAPGSRPPAPRHLLPRRPAALDRRLRPALSL